MKNVKFLLSAAFSICAAAAMAQDFSAPQYAKWGDTPEERERLIQTIQLYFAHDGDIKACAQASYVHRNTFQYWMERVFHRTGYHLRIPKQALLLYIAAQESD